MIQGQERSTHLSENKTLSSESWVDHHGDYIFRYALSRVHDPQRAEDLVQETFLSALKSKESFSGLSSERTWLVGILKHKIVDYLRKINRERPVTDLESEEDFTDQFFDKKGMWKKDRAPSEWREDPRAVFEQKEFMKILDGCLQKLPSRLSGAFTLVEMEGLPSGETCKVLNITATNLWVILYRARMSLRRCLEINWFQKSPEKGK